LSVKSNAARADDEATNTAVAKITFFISYLSLLFLKSASFC
jgi:hypothetical protein